MAIWQYGAKKSYLNMVKIRINVATICQKELDLIYNFIINNSDRIITNHGEYETDNYTKKDLILNLRNSTEYKFLKNKWMEE